MWMLVSTLCIQMDATNADCRRIVGKPQEAPKACREMIRPTIAYTEQLAAKIGGQVLFISVACVKGKDA